MIRSGTERDRERKQEKGKEREREKEVENERRREKGKDGQREKERERRRNGKTYTFIRGERHNEKCEYIDERIEYMCVQESSGNKAMR